MRQLKTLIDKYKISGKKKVDIDEKTVCHLFGQLVREEYGRMGTISVIPTHFKKNVLYVRVGNSVWAQEIWTHRNRLRDRLNDKIGTKIISKITTKI